MATPNLDYLVWESVLSAPLTGVRALLVVLTIAIAFLVCTPFVRSRVSLALKLWVMLCAFAFIPIAFVAEHALLSQPATVRPEFIRTSGICLKVITATVEYGNGVLMLVREQGGQPRFIYVPWEVRFAQAMSRTLRIQQKRGKGGLFLGGPHCMPKERERREKPKEEEQQEEEAEASGIYVLDNFPVPYPDKVELEGDFPQHP